MFSSKTTKKKQDYLVPLDEKHSKSVGKLLLENKDHKLNASLHKIPVKVFNLFDAKDTIMKYFPNDIADDIYDELSAFHNTNKMDEWEDFSFSRGKKYAHSMVVKRTHRLSLHMDIIRIISEKGQQAKLKSFGECIDLAIKLHPEASTAEEPDRKWIDRIRKTKPTVRHGNDGDAQKKSNWFCWA